MCTQKEMIDNVIDKCNLRLADLEGQATDEQIKLIDILCAENVMRICKMFKHDANVAISLDDKINRYRCDMLWPLNQKCLYEYDYSK